MVPPRATGRQGAGGMVGAPGAMIPITEYTQLVWEEIEGAVRKAERDLRRGVLPRDVQSRLPYSRAEGSLRRDMLAMYQKGRLIRLGGEGCRRGYRMPTVIERVSWGLNAGRWPLGAEAA